MKPAVIYISYDGILEPLGESQVLAYLERLSGKFDVHLITFEKRADRRDINRMSAMRSRVATGGIAWWPLAYHKWPTVAATAFDVLCGIVLGLWLVLRHRVGIVHVRSYVPAAMGIVISRLTGAKFLFDIRGYWADERVDGGLWPANGYLYRAAKFFERRFFLAADHIVTLTHASKRDIGTFGYLAGKRPAITVIPTCVNLDVFKPMPRGSSGFILGYVGSVGSWYLFDEVVAFFRVLLEFEPAAKLLVVNRNEHALIFDSLERGGVEVSRVSVVSASHCDVASFISEMTVGTAIVKPANSKIASAPTKLAEYLACGVPCLGNVGIGDMSSVLNEDRVGVVLRNFTDLGRRAAVAELLNLVHDADTPLRCIESARSRFSLSGGAREYERIYDGLLCRSV